ncbi:ABC transporter ATP-binding protein [Aggregatilineales bacterium SYSU G02658]
MGNTVIELKGVSKRFGDYDALINVSLTVSEGALLTLLGPSGCGKTTCLRLIAGITAPDEGEIWLNEELAAGPARSLPPEQRRVGMVFQDYALFPHLSVADNVAFGLRGSRAEKRARVAELLALVGLQGLESQMPYLLSGGQQQRVALARALAPEPDILLLDEPFSNLDTALRVQVRGEVREILRRTGKTAVFVTHDQEEALSLSDRVAVIFDGRLHQVGTPEQIYNQPASAQVAAFVGEANFLPADASGARASSPLGELALIKPMRGEVRVLIRPERVHLDTHGEGVLGEVLWREYYGSRQRIAVSLPDASTLIASTDTQISVERGDRVKVSVFGPLLAFSAVESTVPLPQ